MAPQTTQLGSKPKKPQRSKTRLATLKFDSVPIHSLTSARRLDPLTAFTKTGVLETTTPSPSPPSQIHMRDAKKFKGKSKQDGSTSRDDRLWADIYEPRTEADLAVHVKKVEDVRRWLGEAFEGGPSGKLRKYRRILVLTGPAGTAKTTTVRVLAHEMGFEILEWRNVMGEQLSEDVDFDQTGNGDSLRIPNDYEALFSKFQSFLTRASSCQNIFTRQDVSSSRSPLSGSSTPAGPSQSQSQSPSKRHIILLEDLPNILHSQTQSQFHAALQSLVQSPLTPTSAPVIIIISDAGTRGEASDERIAGGGGWGKGRDGIVDVRTVLSKDLLSGPYVTQIGFNPIAQTLMRKAIQNLLARHFSTMSSAASSPPSKEFLDVIIESANGDIRSAVMALQFACIVELPSGNKKTKIKGKKCLVDAEEERGVRVVLEAISRREQSLALFHLIGRVLYNKRKGDPPSASATAKDIQKDRELDAILKDPPSIPSFLNEHDRKASRVNVDTLYADSPIDSSLFSLYIHQNYPQFCNELDECAGISEWLSWVDSSGGEAWYQANPHRFHLLTLGTLHSLPSPVVRRSQKILKPAFFDVLNKEKDAWDAVRDVRNWILEESIGAEITEAESGPWRAGGWSKTEISTELGGVLNARSAKGADNHAITATHRLFSSLTFQSGNDGVRGVQLLGEGDVDLVHVDIDEVGQEERRVHREKEDARGGWLENDDIEEF